MLLYWDKLLFHCSINFSLLVFCSSAQTLLRPVVCFSALFLTMTSIGEGWKTFIAVKWRFYFPDLTDLWWTNFSNTHFISSLIYIKNVLISHIQDWSIFDQWYSVAMCSLNECVMCNLLVWWHPLEREPYFTSEQALPAMREMSSKRLIVRFLLHEYTVLKY